MYILIYIILMAMAIVFLFLGYYTSNFPKNPAIVFKILAYGFFFMANIGPMLNSEGITYQNGNFVDDTSVADTLTRTVEMSTYTNFWYFFLMVILGGYGATLFAMEEYENWKLRIDKLEKRL